MAATKENLRSALLEEHADAIAAAITDEHGKVFDDAMGEFGRGIEVVDYACGIAELLKGEHARDVGPGIDCGIAASSFRGTVRILQVAAADNRRDRR